MYVVHAFATPNSVKVPIALEELGLAYELRPVNVRQGAQKTPEHLARNPNGKVPVLEGADGFTLTESAAILVHLAETHGGLMSADAVGRARVFEQLFLHASGVSPAFGNAGWFIKFAPEPQPIAVERFSAEARRLVGLLDATLAARPFMAGDAFTIADIAHFGWFWRRAFAGVDLDDAPNLARWYAAVESRPAVVRALARMDALAA
jgi:GST-like protein